jgi:segregation and condensation protein B
MLDPNARTVEALLFVSPEPISLEELAGAASLPVQLILSALAELETVYLAGGHGIRLERNGGAVRLVTAPEAGAAIARFQGLDRPPKLSAAALDALAIVAYRQPVTRAEVDSIRGVSSEHVLTVLQNLSLIEEVGRADSIGRPVLLGTTSGFLESAGLTSLVDLPESDDLREQATPYDSIGA